MVCSECSAFRDEKCILGEESYMTSYEELGCKRQKRTIDREVSEIDEAEDKKKKEEDGKLYNICPMCGTKFIKGEEHKYVLREGYTCSWKCFMRRVRGESCEFGS